MYHNHIPYLEMEIFQGGGDGRTITSKICYKNIEDYCILIYFKKEEIIKN